MRQAQRQSPSLHQPGRAPQPPETNSALDKSWGQCQWHPGGADQGVRPGIGAAMANVGKASAMVGRYDVVEARQMGAGDGNRTRDIQFERLCFELICLVEETVECCFETSFHRQGTRQARRGRPMALRVGTQVADGLGELDFDTRLEVVSTCRGNRLAAVNRRNGFGRHRPRRSGTLLMPDTQTVSDRPVDDGSVLVLR